MTVYAATLKGTPPPKPEPNKPAEFTLEDAIRKCSDSPTLEDLRAVAEAAGYTKEAFAEEVMSSEELKKELESQNMSTETLLEEYNNQLIERFEKSSEEMMAKQQTLLESQQQMLDQQKRLRATIEDMRKEVLNATDEIKTLIEQQGDKLDQKALFLCSSGISCGTPISNPSLL